MLEAIIYIIGATVMGISHGTEDEARTIRTTEDRANIRQSDSSREGRFGESIERDGYLSFRTTGTIGERAHPAILLCLTGGILSQLIELLEHQLAEAKASIDWYQNQERRLESQIAKLRELQAMERGLNADQ